MDNKSFEQAIGKFRESKLELDNMFGLLAKNIVENFGKDIIDDKESAIEKLKKICWEKLDRYDLQKGKAYNFFTTIMLCYLRQLYRKKKNWEELKKDYKEFIKKKLKNSSPPSA